MNDSSLGESGNASTSKRPKRASRPCDACRNRKTRCVTEAGQSTCTMCQHRSSSCTYAVNARSPTSVKRRSSGSGDRVVPPRSPRDVQDKTEMAVDRPLSAGQHRFAELYGLTSDAEPILMRYRPYNSTTQEHDLGTHAIRRAQLDYCNVDYPVVFHILADEKSAEYVDESSDWDSIETLIQPYGPRLLDLFWRLAHPSFPLLSQRRHQTAYDASHRNIDAALLGAVYLQALVWWAYDPELSLCPVPDMVKLRRKTLEAIQHSFHRPRLSSIQAVIIYLQCSSDQSLTPDHTFARGLTAQTLAISEAVGLHLDASNWCVPAWEKAERKRLSWAVFMQDKWSALAYGRPSHIAQDNWMVKEPVKEDFDCFEDGIDSLASANQFKLMVTLSSILSAVLSTLFTLKNSIEQDTVKLFDLALPMLQQLLNAKTELDLLLPAGQLREGHLSSAASVHICYWGIIINIYRRLIRSTALHPACSNRNMDSDLRQQGIHVARQAASFITSLRLDQLESHWYFPTPYLFSVVGSFQTLLLLTATSAIERETWHESLHSYLWSLRVMTKSNESARYAVNRLEGGVLRGLEDSMNMHVPTDEPLNVEDILRQLDSAANGQPFTAGFPSPSFDWLMPQSPNI